METTHLGAAVVTGGGSGIGAASARGLALDGFQVVVADINLESARHVADQIRADGGTALPFQVDISEAKQVSDLMTTSVEAFGGIAVLHNNAAETSEASMKGDTNVVDLDLDVLDRAYAVNVRGTFLCCRYAIKSMIERGGGSIINTSSNSATAGAMTLTSYGITKGAVNVLTKYVATQYGQDGIRCNAIVPGLTLTPSVERNLAPEAVATHRGSILARSFAVPDDIASLVRYLATAPDYLTGQIISMDGGQYAHSPVYSANRDR